MSKIYDDLKRKSPQAPSSINADAQPDLFSFAAQQAKPSLSASNDAPARSDTIEAPPTSEASDNGEATPTYLRRGLERNPSFSSIIEPLSALPPLRKRRRQGWLYASLGLALVVIVIFGARHLVRRRSTSPAPTAVVKHPTAEPRISSPAPAASARSNEPQPPSAAARPPVSRWLVPGARIETIDNVEIIFFENGLFAGGIQLMPASRRSLLTLARQLAPYGSRLSITIIGCTDNMPVNPGSRFKDNIELGTARAREVASVLRSASGLPNSVFHVVSYGDRWAPYPNDTPQNRARNRTVVLRISVRP